MKKKVNINKKKEKKTRKRYTQEALNSALQAVKNGMPKKEASRTFNVPRPTLQFRLKNPNHNPRPGPATVLSVDEELQLKNWLKICCRKGFPKRKENLLSSVAQFIKKDKRPNPFKNGVPGEKWYQLFLQRHPDLTIRTPEAVTAASAAVSEKDLRKWFSDIEAYLKDQNLFEVLSDPSRVFNGDETGFLMCPKKGVVIAPLGEQNVYEVDNAPAKTNITVMFSFGANGVTTPPMVIFPNVRLRAEIQAKVPKDWGIGLSDNGWMKAELFYNYIKNVFHSFLVKTKTKFPVILFVDGHKTHLTYETSELCSYLNIVLIALYPNCTRILQPADVSAFKPLKDSWKKVVIEWRDIDGENNENKTLTKIEFVPLLQKALLRCSKPETIINGFRATGLFPWNPDAINYSKCLGRSNTSQDSPKTPEEKVMTREDFIKLLETNTDMPIIEKIWNFYDDISPTLQSKNNSQEMKMDIECMEIIISDQTEDRKAITNYKTISPTLQSKNNSRQMKMEIESMEIIISDQTEDLKAITNYKTIYTEPDPIVNSNNTLIDHAPVIETVKINASENSSPINHTYTEPRNAFADINYSEESQDIHSITVSHTVEINTVHDRKSPNKQQEQLEVPAVGSNGRKKYSNEDFDKIEIISEENNPSFKTPVKVNLKKIELTDVLKIPKTPQRKGVKSTKRTSFVMTSQEWKAEMLQKQKIKQDKEEGIKKRKEERLQKKLQKEADKKNKLTKNKKKTNNKAKTDVKKILFSDAFTNLDIDIDVKRDGSAKLRSERLPIFEIDRLVNQNDSDDD